MILNIYTMIVLACACVIRGARILGLILVFTLSLMLFLKFMLISVFSYKVFLSELSFGVLIPLIVISIDYIRNKRKMYI